MRGEPDQDGWFSVDDKLPLAGERVKVKCPTHRCLGYLDEDGTWHWCENCERLEEVVAWQSL